MLILLYKLLKKAMTSDLCSLYVKMWVKLYFSQSSQNMELSLN